jgi:energy-coupling factor transport system ATP-binding protein
MAAEGIWLPMTCRLTQALRERGWPLTGCPLSLDEVEAALRSRGEAFGGSAAEALVRTQAAGESTSSPPNASPLPAVAISRLTFAYPDSQPSLNDANLSIARGRFFALVGANGSGKTTLAKHLVGLLRPASGTVHVLGHDTRRQSASELARQVGYVFQNPEHQFVTERVADELAYSLHGRWGQEETDRRVRDLLSTFGLEGYEEDNPFALSQGQKRRLSVATMLALHQPILILDEPTFGQDQQSTSALMETLKTLHQAGTTIVFITHDMQLVAEYADEVAVMHEGRVIFQGTPHALFQQPAVLEQASLVLPPLAELAHRLGLPPLLTVEEWRAWADATAPKASHLP